MVLSGYIKYICSHFLLKNRHDDKKSTVLFLYCHIFIFRKKHHLLEYLKSEVIMRDKFVIHRLTRNGMQRQRGFLLW